MKRIFYAWEMGSGFGHVANFLPLARALEKRGCAIHWAVLEPSLAATRLREAGYAAQAAPRFQGEVMGLPEPQLAYSEVLLRHGYIAQKWLEPLLHQWRAMLTQAAPDLVIADHAPTALLAARSLKLRTARIGTGFCCPPAQDPEAPLLWWAPPGAERAALSSAKVLSSVNPCLERLGLPPLPSLASLYQADEDFVTTYPGLDHYRARATRLWGAILGNAGQAPPLWPGARGPRVFVYLRGDQPQALALLRVLRRRHWPVLAHCPGLPQAAQAELACASLHIATDPLDMNLAIGECDMVVCGSGHGTVCTALLAGKPLLVAPTHAEQEITARNVEALGAGLTAAVGQDGRFSSLLTRLVFEPAYARAAQAFRARHGGTSQAQIVEAIASRCLEPGND